MAQEQEQVLQEQRLMLMATMILMVLAEQFGPLLSPKFAYHTHTDMGHLQEAWCICLRNGPTINKN